MNKLENINNTNDLDNTRNTAKKHEKIKFDAEINLNENESDKEDDFLKNENKHNLNRKYKINPGNIQKRNQIQEIKPIDFIEYTKKSQIIVISRKREREGDSKKIHINNSIRELDKNKILISKDELTFNPHKKFKIDKIINNDISYKLDNLNINNQQSKPVTILDNHSEIIIKNRNYKNFNESKCKIYSTHDVVKNIYHNYYPSEIPDDYSLKLKQNNFDTILEDKRTHISERRQLKFMEKRKISSRQNISNDFSDIKKNYNKVFGEDFHIINEKNEDKMIIVNRNPIDKKEIEAFFETNLQNMPELQIYECSNNFNESDILNFVIQKENEKIVLDGELDSDSEYNQEIDYDSNREDNSCNDYPDEGDDFDDDDYYNPYDNEYDYDS